MKSTYLAYALAFTAILSSCQKPENTTYTPADSFVIGDAAFFERFETEIHAVRKIHGDQNEADYRYDFYYRNRHLRIGIYGLLKDFYDESGQYRRKSSYWEIAAEDVLATVRDFSMLKTEDTINRISLIQYGVGMLPPYSDTVEWKESEPFEVIKLYEMGDTVHWELDEKLISDYQNDLNVNLRDFSSIGNRNIGATIFSKEYSSYPKHSDPSWINSFETNISNDLSGNKFVVCKFKWQPENPPAGFDDEIEKLMVIEIGLTQDSIIDVLNVYNEKYLPL